MVSAVNLLDVIRVVIDDSVGTRGALANCRRELARIHDNDQAVRQLCSRIQAADSRLQPTTDEPRHRPAS